MEKTAEQVLGALLSSADTQIEQAVPMPRLGVEFTIKPITSRTMQTLRERATFGKEVNEEKLSLLFIDNACVTPNWSAPELLEKYGGREGIDVIEAALLPGEKVRLTKEIMNVSGFGDIPAEIEATKK
ncbi:hypothetical protein EEL32_16880 [Brevibacillus laterosporus]|nr:hypothetical protein [Brevibacillus laterosporus]TPG84191.1 hypothetical protein EEL32_16880 [Brevibacillus laterosporus]